MSEVPDRCIPAMIITLLSICQVLERFVSSASDRLRTLSQLLNYERGLHGELSRGDEDQRLNHILRRVNLLYHWNGVGGGLPSPVLGTRYNVLSLQNLRNGLLLNWRRILVSHIIDPLQHAKY